MMTGEWVFNNRISVCRKYGFKDIPNFHKWYDTVSFRQRYFYRFTIDDKGFGPSFPQIAVLNIINYFNIIVYYFLFFGCRLKRQETGKMENHH